jgi:hypothetical protein
MLEIRMYYLSVGRKLQLIDGFVLLSDAGKNVIISNQPYFYKKAELFPGSAFVIGADTAARLVNVRS